uniref:DOMON domain-containing protein n=1 Tax=Anopheles quadriannulatus TaxID=34691 RepID=A0A182WX57_ANOQN
MPSARQVLVLLDRHIRPDSDGEPIYDASQDYTLLLGYENTTHTVIRFKRNLDTCDMKDDFPITQQQRGDVAFQ